MLVYTILKQTKFMLKKTTQTDCIVTKCICVKMAFKRVAKNIFGLLLVFSMATGWLVYLTTVFKGQAGVKITFPGNLEQLKQLSSELDEVKNLHMSLLLVLFCSAYLYKQTFAIPGSVFMLVLIF